MLASVEGGDHSDDTGQVSQYLEVLSALFGKHKGAAYSAQAKLYMLLLRSLALCSYARALDATTFLVLNPASPGKCVAVLYGDHGCCIKVSARAGILSASPGSALHACNGARVLWSNGMTIESWYPSMVNSSMPLIVHFEGDLPAKVRPLMPGDYIVAMTHARA